MPRTAEEPDFSPLPPGTRLPMYFIDSATNPITSNQLQSFNYVHLPPPDVYEAEALREHNRFRAMDSEAMLRSRGEVNPGTTAIPFRDLEWDYPEGRRPPREVLRTEAEGFTEELPYGGLMTLKNAAKIALLLASELDDSGDSILLRAVVSLIRARGNTNRACALIERDGNQWLTPRIVFDGNVYRLGRFPGWERVASRLPASLLPAVAFARELPEEGSSAADTSEFLSLLQPVTRLLD